MVAVILRRADPLYARVLVGTDGSARAACAVRLASRLAALTGAGLEIAHVHERPLVPSIPGWRADPIDESDDILAEATRAAGDGSVRPSTVLLTGHASAALATEARRSFCDLVVVGPDASFLEKPRMFGGVAARSLHEGACSVLVARAGADERAFPARVLCAVDGSEGAAEAARQGALLAGLSRGQLRMLTVTADRPAPSIVRTAGVWNADLVVVGTHGRHGLTRVLAGSVSEWVAAHAPCSVLVARPRSR